MAKQGTSSAAKVVVLLRLAAATQAGTTAGVLVGKGAVVGVAAVAVLESLAAAYVRTQSDLERRLDIPVIAVIPNE